MVSLCVVAQGEGGSPRPSPAPQQVPPLLGWCSGLPRRGQGSEGSELSIPLRRSHQGRNGDGSTTIGTATGRATKPGSAAGTGLCGHLPSVVGAQDSASGFSVAGDSCHQHLHPTDTAFPSPHHRCRPARLCSAPRSAAGATPGFCPQPDTSKTKANSPAAEGAIFTAGLNEEVFFDLLKILNII